MLANLLHFSQRLASRLGVAALACVLSGVPAVASAIPAYSAIPQGVYAVNDGTDDENTETPAAKTFKVTVTQPTEGGTIDVTGASNLDAVAEGTKLTVTAKTNDGYELEKIIAGDTDITADKTVTVTSDLTITATFKLKEFKVTLVNTPEEGGKVTVNTNELTKVQWGTELTVTAIPETGYELVSIKAGNSAIENGSKVKVTSDLTITATFKLKEFVVTIGNPSNGSFTVKTADGKNIDTKVTYGTELTITAIPNQGYKIKSVTAGDETLEPTSHTSNTYKYTVKSDVSITASFVKDESKSAVLTIVAPTNGTITVKSAEGQAYVHGESIPAGTEIIVTATAKQGYKLTKLIVDSKSTTYDSYTAEESVNYTVSENASAIVVSADFAEYKTYTVSWETNPANGTISVTQNETEVASGNSFENNTTLTVTLTAASGYYPTLTSTVPGSVTETSTSPNKQTKTYTVTVTGNMTLTPTFSANPTGSSTVTIEQSGSGSVGVYSDADCKTAISVRNNIFSAQIGSTVYVKVTPATNYTAEATYIVKGNPTEIRPNDNGIGHFTVADMAGTLKVNFIAPTTYYTVKASENLANGTIEWKLKEGEGESNPEKVASGKVITVTVKANEGYRIKTAYGTTVATGSTTTELTYDVTVTRNTELTATFEAIPQGSLNLTITSNISGTTKGLQSVTATYSDGTPIGENDKIKAGTKIKVVAIADDQYQFESMKIGSATATLNSTASKATIAEYTLSNPTSAGNFDIKGNATLSHRTLVVNYSANVSESGTDRVPDGKVTVSYKNGNSYTPINSSNRVPTDTEIRFVATPNAGFEIESMTVDGVAGEPVKDTNGNWTITTTTPAAAGGYNAEPVSYDITVKFRLKPFKVTVSVPKGTDGKPLGTITLSAGGTDILEDALKNTGASVYRGTDIRLSVTAPYGKHIASITVNGVKQDIGVNPTEADVTIEKIASNTQFNVTYENRKYQVSVMGGTGGEPYVGSTRGITAESYLPNTTVYIHANPLPGYKFVHWLENGAVVNGTNNKPVGADYSFKLTDMARSFIAVYEAVTYTNHYVTLAVPEAQKDWGKVEFISPATTGLTVSTTGVVTFKATPADTQPADGTLGRYSFVNWTNNAGIRLDDSSNPEQTYGGNLNTTFTANFRRNCQVIFDTNPRYGTMEILGPDGSIITTDQYLAPGTVVTVNITTISNKFKVNLITINGANAYHYSSHPTSVSQRITVSEDMLIACDIYDPTGIDGIETDEAAQQPEQWYTVQGQYLGTERPTRNGIYIVRRGGKAEKVAIND